MSELPNYTEFNLEGLDAASPSLSFLTPALAADELGRLAHYRVLKVLGQGGMGIVLHAEDTQLQRPVALKVMRPDLGQGTDHRQRFLREARAMAQVKSDHVVTVHQVGQLGEVCFLAMELLEGEPLDRWLDRAGVPAIAETVRIGREIALALAAAHGRGLIHRDVKPANVWLEAPNRRVKLLDFGLARPLDADVELTGYGMVVGTPMYMAPEQARAEALDGRADLFSLGCLLYRMVTGRPAFEGKTPLEVMTAVVGYDPPPPSQFQPAVPASLNELLGRLLAKQPSARPPSAEVVAVELQAIAHALSHTDLSIGSAVGGQSQASPTPHPSVSAATPVFPSLVPLSRLSAEMSQSRRHARDAERRQVTVLVCGCDLFDTEAFLVLDSEDQAQVLASFQHMCQAAIHPFDGTVVQCTEQGLLACFGFPTAHEDAASRAARAGLRLVEEAKTLSANLRRTHQLEAKVWVGLHTGPAIVEAKEERVILVGEARNVAVRLKDAMAVDRVVCTEASQRLFKGGFLCTDLGARTIGGVPRPVTLFTVDGVADSGSSLTVSIPAGLSPLVGRDHEVSLLKDRWERAQDGMSQVVFLVGEPGLGKSRLVHTLKEFVLQQAVEGETDAPVIEWRCSPHYQNTGLHPAIDFYERTLNFRAEEAPTVRFDRLLQHIAHYGLARPEAVPLWASLLSVPVPDHFPRLSLSPVRQREETFRLMLEWLRVRAERGPVLFVVEDLHWADASTLEFLGQALGDYQRDRILAVFTFRPEFKPPWPAAEQLSILALARLTRRQVADLMRKKAGGALRDAVIEQVYERVGGVPLFIEEFTKVVQEADARDATRAADASAVLAHGIPSSLQDLVMARLDRMEGGRDVAQLGAVIGREFAYELLAAVTTLDDAILQTELANLTRAEIVHAKGRPPQCTYVFKHALLEDALYGSLVKVKRQQLHRLVAEALATRFPQTGDTHPELLAHHFTEAGLADRAVGYWLAAGLRSRERSALNEAIAQLTRGLALLETLEPSAARDGWELQLLSALAPAYIAARGYAAPEAGPVLLRARELCQRSDDPRPHFGVLLGMWEWRLVRGDLSLCPDLAADGMEIAERLDDSGMHMEALFMPAVTMFYSAQFAGACEYIDTALAKYDDRARTKFWTAHTGHDAGVTHRCYQALTLWHLGFPDRALQVNREALALARSIGHAFSLGHALDFSAFLHLYCRLGPEVRTAADEEKVLATEQGFQMWRALGTLHSGASLLLDGRPREALPILLEGYRAFRATGAGIRAPAYLGILADAYTQTGQFGEAHAELNEAMTVVEKNGDRFHEAELHRLRGELLRAESTDRHSEAEVSFRRAIETAQRHQSRGWELRAAIGLSRFLYHGNRREEARTTLASIYDTYTEGFATPDLVEARELLEECIRDG